MHSRALPRATGDFLPGETPRFGHNRSRLANQFEDCVTGSGRDWGKGRIGGIFGAYATILPGDGSSRLLGAAQRLAAIAERLGDMDAPDRLGPVEIGERAGDAERAVIAARAERERVGRLAQERKP